MEQAHGALVAVGGGAHTLLIVAEILTRRFGLLERGNDLKSSGVTEQTSTELTLSKVHVKDLTMLREGCVLKVM